jgi:predicted transcriptional regulator
MINPGCSGGFMVRKTIQLSEELVKQVTLIARKEDRDFSSSLRHALRIGILALENPELTAEEIRDVLEAGAELDAGMAEELNIEDL